MCCQYTRSSQSIKIGSNQVIFIDWWQKSVEIDKRNKCVIDFYWLIDPIISTKSDLPIFIDLLMDKSIPIFIDWLLLVI